MAPEPPGRALDLRAAVGAADQRTLGKDDDVGHHVADDDDVAGHLEGRPAADGDLGGDGGVVLDQRDVGDERLAAGQLEDALEEERRQRLAGDALALGAGDRLGDARLDLGGVERRALGDRVGDEDAAKTFAELDFQRCFATASASSRRWSTG